MDMQFKEIESFYLEALQELGVSNKDIKKGTEDIACKCPICGDSRYGNKKRLHLYKKGKIINVNCFNGDCSAKNLHPWKFFKLYATRTFLKFKDYRRQRFLQALVPKTEKLETVKADFDLVCDSESSLESQNSRIIQFLENFEIQDQETDLVIFIEFCKSLSTAEKQELKKILESR